MMDYRTCSMAGFGLLLLAQLATAAPPAPSLPDAIRLITKDNRPMPAVQLLRQGVDAKTFPGAAAAQFYAVSGDTQGTYRMIDASARVPDVSKSQPDFTGAVLRPALETVVPAAKDRRVVMLNEDHVHQLHRGFALQLLKDLRAQGFTHFGAETFGRKARESLIDDAPDVSTGVYTSDPLYADLARQAKALGFQVFDYEQRKDQEPAEGSQEDQRMARERAQAANIASVLNDDPKARAFVYAGAGHISESPEGDGRIWMAQILREVYGIDPLTINQVYGTPRSRPELDGAEYRATEALGPFTAPVVVATPTGLFSAPGFDILVFHPRERQKHGRPDWLELSGYRHPCRISLKPSNEETMVRAFVASEDPMSIPMDQVLVPVHARSVVMMLPPGEYRMVRQTVVDDRLLGLGRVRKAVAPKAALGLCRPAVR
ncbi:hypothetical protein [Lysobacter sp. ESA13C]|uniref:hypothetical protein n=1 Tax=Lysobacter sp. ESA13C TaxID=2862676 RepID=UPI001CBF0528|nr:hypothetical protein [Lysobacter sp. ESA13C]